MLFRSERAALAGLVAKREDFVYSAAVLKEGIERCPHLHSLSNNYAYLLATTSAEEVRDGAEALRIAKQITSGSNARQPEYLDPLAAALDIVNAAQRNDLAVEAAGKIYFQVGERLGLHWLRTSARGFSANTHWQRQAVTAIIDDLYVQQRALTSSVIEANGDGAADGAVNGWIDAHRAAVGRNEQLLADLRKSGAVDIAMLTVANRQIRVLAAG